MSAHEAETGIEIAIVGMAGRFPGAANVAALWRNLSNAVESVTRFDDAVLRARGVSESLLGDPHYVKAGIELDGVAEFDAGFFGFSPRDAEQLDPQQRVFLEVAWEALEHAGYAGSERPDVIGTFAGSGANFYLLRHLLPSLSQRGNVDVASLLAMLNANDKDSLATRVAYKLNLRGPAISVQTACSTSLVAVHQACQSLLCHEVDMALAGGVWLNLLQGQGYGYQVGGILSPDGHCRAFDADAAGTAIGSGAGVVVLKRLADARASGDTIFAVIKGSAINNDGAAKVGYTAPSVDGQETVIRAALAIAEVPARSIGYVEAHGTGTALGDPIELAALTRAYRASTDARGYCAIGALKTNIGHLDAAAGVAGLIKASLALYNECIPASLNFSAPNPQIEFENSPFFVCRDAIAWPRGASVRRAAVSSFGMGGTNAHLILEEAPQTSQRARASSWELLQLSARSPSALVAASHELAGHLRSNSDCSLADVAHTLSVGRARFDNRAAAVAAEPAVAAGLFDSVSASDCVTGVVLSERPSVAFLFPGQGAQRAGVGRELYARFVDFRAVLDACCAQLRPQLDVDLRELLLAEPAHAERASEALQRTLLTQPALFVFEYALASLWRSLGLVPDAMLGHSVGEYVAATLAGVFDLNSALGLIVARGRALQASPPGAMLAVALSERELEPFLGLGCEVAAVNAAASCVLSGSLSAIEQVERALNEHGLGARRLRVSHAYHSSSIEPALKVFEADLRRVERRAPQIPFISNVSGRFITAAEAQSVEYWVRHARSCVRFHDGLTLLLSKADRVVLEVGPSEVLTKLARRHEIAAGERIVTSLGEGRGEVESLLRGRASLWVAGVETRETQPNDALPPARVPLPTYPFERQRYWVEASSGPVEAAERRGSARTLDDWLYEARWKPSELASGCALSAGETVLLLGPASGFCVRLAAALRARGAEVIVAETGANFARIHRHRYMLELGNLAELTRLFSLVNEDVGPVAHVCHLSCLDVAMPVLPEQCLEQGYSLLLNVARALDASIGPAAKRVRITSVVNGLEDVTGIDRVIADKATLLGASRVVPLEYPNVECRVLDVLVAEADSVAEQRLIEQVSLELAAPIEEPLVAYRGARRWTPAYEPVRVGAAARVQLREGGAYLITGGFGGVGLALAQSLARSKRARLALVGRGALPPREQWSDIIAHERGSAELRWRLARLLELVELGADLLIIEADVCDRAAMREAVRTAKARFGALHGVIHAAGVAGGCTIDKSNPAETDRVLAPKLSGTRSLLAALASETPDFVVFCSSLTAVAADVSQADYCAANCFLDAVAVEAQRESRAVVLSIAWDTWRGVGMAAAQRLPDAEGIEAAHGLDLLEKALACSPLASRVLVSKLELTSRFERRSVTGLAQRFAAPTARVQQARPTLRTPYVEPESPLEQDLAGLWAELTGVSPIGADDSLFELGGDSLLAVQLLARVSKQYGVEPNVAAFLRAPSVASLATWIETKLIEEIETSAAGSAASE
ncbi:MAG: SDR family NAD(P)-dependent oxidoreductase [Polyangiaceae bacterium]